MSKPVTAAGPGLVRQLASMFYDALVVLALWFVCALPVVLILGGPPQSAPTRGLFQVWLLVVTFGFFGYFWVHGGQTVGMRAWRIRIVAAGGAAITWRHAAIRFAVAALSGGAVGLGYLWIYLDPQRRSWHDRASGTCLVLVEKAAR